MAKTVQVASTGPTRRRSPGSGPRRSATRSTRRRRATTAGSRVEAEVDRLVALGATVVGPKEERGELCVVLQDPEGNELCLT